TKTRKSSIIICIKVINALIGEKRKTHATQSTAEKACQTRKSGFFNKIKRSKTTLLRALPIKLAVQVFRMSEVCRTNEAEKVEFSRLSIIRLKVYSARKEGRTDPQAGIVTALAESSLCFIV